MAYIESGFKNASHLDSVKEQPLFPESYEAFKSLKQGLFGLVFRNENGTLFCYRQLPAAFDRAIRKAGLPYTGTHVMRHGGARHVYNETGDLAIAEQLVGNSDLQPTLVDAKRHKDALSTLAEAK